MAAVGAWALLGLTALERTDAAGAVGAAVLLLFLWRGRAPAVYAGVFFAVAFLEIYGTAIGTWRWAEEIPGLGVPDGNPPSGAASGYVFFDISALALAPAAAADVGAGHGRACGRSEMGAARLGVPVPSHPAEGHLRRPLGRRGGGVLGRGRDHRLPPGHRHLPADVGEVEASGRAAGRAAPRACSSAGAGGGSDGTPGTLPPRGGAVHRRRDQPPLAGR